MPNDTVPALGGAMPAAGHPDAALLALARRWRKTAVAAGATGAALSLASDRAVFPEPPEALFARRDDHALLHMAEPDFRGRRWYYTVAEGFGPNAKPPLAIWRYGDDRPEIIAIRARALEVIEAAASWDRAKAEVREAIGLGAAEEADNRAHARNRRLRARILGMPATTLDGVLVKAEVCAWCLGGVDGLFRQIEDESAAAGPTGEAFAFSLALDLARIAAKRRGEA
jgi:hypothetical protein